MLNTDVDSECLCGGYIKYQCIEIIWVYYTKICRHQDNDDYCKMYLEIIYLSRPKLKILCADYWSIKSLLFFSICFSSNS